MDFGANPTTLDDKLVGPIAIPPENLAGSEHKPVYDANSPSTDELLNPNLDHNPTRLYAEKKPKYGPLKGLGYETGVLSVNSEGRLEDSVEKELNEKNYMGMTFKDKAKSVYENLKTYLDLKKYKALPYKLMNKLNRKKLDDRHTVKYDNRVPKNQAELIANNKYTINNEEESLEKMEDFRNVMRSLHTELRSKYGDMAKFVSDQYQMGKDNVKGKIEDMQFKIKDTYGKANERLNYLSALLNPPDNRNVIASGTGYKIMNPFSSVKLLPATAKHQEPNFIMRCYK